MPYIHTLTVRWRDCDMYEHVNNAVYFTYFEEARGHFWRRLRGEAFTGFDFIIAESTCTYRSAATLDETLDIAVAVTAIGTKSFHLAYRITEVESGREVAVGRSVQVMYDHATKQTFAIDDPLRARLVSHISP